MGFHPSQAGQVLVWANVGGAIGATLLGLFASKLPLKQLLIGVLFAGFVMVSAFGIGYESLGQMALISIQPHRDLKLHGQGFHKILF